MPKVSVVMAAYNHGRYIEGALRSALGQTMNDLEIHVVDDGSTDDTAERVAPFLDKGRVFYHRQENGGQAKAKNRGIQASRGEFVAFLDADDEWLSDKLARQLPLFDDPAVGVACCGRTVIDPEGNALDIPARPMHRGMVIGRVFVDNFVCFSSSVVRRIVFERMGAFDESLRLSIDYDLWIRVAEAWLFDYVDAPLTRYRTGHAQLSNKAMERVRTAFRVMERHADHPVRRLMIGADAIREAYAMTHATAAYILNRQGRSREAAGHALASIRRKPFQAGPWRQLLKAAAIGAGMLEMPRPAAVPGGMR